ncbi:hypothetical protein ACJ73_02233 [Blastomyces percursus]|uniref:Uncharacterized protein n=1 Tax=Blastomyces percursus TaxID=1658174 RepID=A0A1J9QE60_9EURO|nr:hypothetical protein ACJ73_02233 [Blastomyces percursus]
MPHKVDSYPSSTLSARDSKNVRIHNAQGFNLRRTAAKGLDLQKASGGSCTQPRKPHLRREEAFRLGRRPMEIDTGGDSDGCASWSRRPSGSRPSSTQREQGRTNTSSSHRNAF